ncbi:MAG: hypothetical protein R3F11_06915 [Verrucomicrobiales bacterium]
MFADLFLSLLPWTFVFTALCFGAAYWVWGGQGAAAPANASPNASGAADLPQAQAQAAGAPAAADVADLEEARRERDAALERVRAMEQSIEALAFARRAQERAGSARVAEMEDQLARLAAAVAAAAQPGAPVESPAGDPEPAALDAAHPGPHPDSDADPDPGDLQRIRGIGPGLAKKLIAAGVRSAGQIAQWSDSDAEAVGVKLGIGSRIKRGRWIEQAKRLTGGDRQR